VADRGHVFKLLDADGISRKTWLYVPDETTGQPMPSLAVALAQVYNRNLDESPISLPNPVPQLEDNAAWINWPDKPQTLTTYSFADVLADQIDPAVFANKIVLFGITAAAFDPLQTPFPDQPTAAGVYLHGAVLNNLLQRNFLQRSPQGLNRLLLLSLAMGSAWVLNRQGFRNRILLLLAFPLAWFGVAVVAFSVNYWLPIAAPMATVWLTGVGLQMREQREKRLLMTLFAKHVAPETAQLIWRRRTEIFQEGELQAQELPATVLFMDIRGFTTISERFQPAELLHWLNRYLDVMTNCIMDHGGVVDKYIGDAIMAVFGIPVPRPDEAGIRQDALNAIAASLEMYDRLQTLNQAFSQEGKPTIRFGIGIHTGTVVAGSVGGSRHIEYSVIGDTVNTAARIEALNKKPDPDNPYDLLVSGQTYAYIRQYYGAKAMQALRLRGKATATVIYAIQGPQQGDGLVMEDEKSILRRLLT
jgi:class 3 adenylate cyclase